MLCKRCECMKWGTVVALFGFTAGISFYFLFLGAGLVLGREPPRVCLDAPHTPQAPITRRVAAAAIMRKPQLLLARIPPWRQPPAPPAPPAQIYVRPRIAEQPPWRQSPKSKPDEDRGLPDWGFGRRGFICGPGRPGSPLYI